MLSSKFFGTNKKVMDTPREAITFLLSLQLNKIKRSMIFDNSYNFLTVRK